jgi:hypothetical protein
MQWLWVVRRMDFGMDCCRSLNWRGLSEFRRCWNVGYADGLSGLDFLFMKNKQPRIFRFAQDDNAFF